MANNANRNNNNNNNGPMNEHVEFSVKAEEDLYLQGSENTIKRVTAETLYSCLMLKTQRFSSLFRHYAKYHGLRKDDLEYYFVNMLENDDTPETVHLQRGDTIMVRKRRKPEPPEKAADDDEFFVDMKALLHDEEHMDMVLVVNTDGGGGFGRKKKEEDDGGKKPIVEVPAHRAVLTARTEFFKDKFRKSGPENHADSDDMETLPESSSSTPNNNGTAAVLFKFHVEGGNFSEQVVRWVLEFIYTNRIADISFISTDGLLQILHLSDLWLLRDLKRLVEHVLIRDHMSVETVARLYGATEDFHARRLSRSCIEFIMSNLRELAGNETFENEMKNYPHLCIPVLKAAADLIPDGPVHKKQRTTMAELAMGGTPTSATAAFRSSSPVPDSDT